MKNIRVSLSKIFTKEIFLGMFEETPQRKGAIKCKRKDLNTMTTPSLKNLNKPEGYILMIKALGNSHFVHLNSIFQINEIKIGNNKSNEISNSSLDILSLTIKIIHLRL